MSMKCQWPPTQVDVKLLHSTDAQFGQNNDFVVTMTLSQSRTDHRLGIWLVFRLSSLNIAKLAVESTK